MKFNPEKAKDLIKKTVVGAEVITASLSSLESNAQEAKQNQDTIQNKIELSTDPEYHRNEYIKYMEHPSYKVRLAKEMYGDEVIDDEKQKKIDLEYNERIDQIKKVNIEINPKFDPNSYFNTPNYDVNTNKIGTNDEGVYHEISHSLDTRYDKSTKAKGFKLKTREIIGSTKGELEQKIDSLILKNPNDIYIDALSRSLGYLRESSELKARLNHLRMQAVKKYNFDLKKDFNINDFNELKNDSQYIDIKRGLGLSDDQINELMKYIALDENINNDTYYHPGWNYNDNNNNKA